MAGKSLIQLESAQMDLIPSSEIMDLVLTKEEENGEFTGERLFQQHPEKYAVCIDLLAEGIGIRRIARMLHISHNTIRAVRDREGDTIDTVKERIATKVKHGVEMCAEAILDDLDDDAAMKKISTRDKSIILGVLSEKYLLMANQATAIIDVRNAEPEHDDFNAYIAGLKTVDSPTTGNQGGRSEQKDGSGPGARPAPFLDAEFTETDTQPQPAATAPEEAESADSDGQTPQHVVDGGQNAGE